MPRNFAEAEGLSSRIAPAKQADHSDQHKTRFDKDLPAVEPVDGVALQCRIGEEAMKEKSGSREIDAEMKRLPKVAAQPKAKVRSEDYESEEIEGNGPNRVFERLAGGVDWIDEVQDAKAWVLVQQQDGRMQERH